MKNKKKFLVNYFSSLVAGMTTAFLNIAVAEPVLRRADDQPFSDDSIWNTPLGLDAEFLSPDDPESKMLHSDDVGGKSNSYAWISVDATGVYKTGESDPLATWYYDVRSASANWPSAPPLTQGSIKLYTPNDIKFFGSTDHVIVLIDPDGKTAYEMWLGEYTKKKNLYHTRYLVRVDMKGSGIASGENRSEGIRAFGGSLLGGLIRCSELERSDIRHAVPILVSPSQARRGKTMTEQKVWPAMNTDGGGKNNYSGLVPIGRLVAIPPQVDLNKLKLTREGLTLARSLQEFGGYVVDTATNTMSIGAIESGCRQQSVDHLFLDIRKIRDQLLPVVNNDPNHIGGPGRRVAAAPPHLK
jgi:hypothetical protein